MKKLCCLIVMFFTCTLCEGQILCIYCDDQNDSISNNVNNLLLNGSLENGCPVPAYFCPNSIGYGCDITNWTCSGGGSNTYATVIDNSFSVIPEGTKAAYFGNAICHACSMSVNDTSCINNINCTVADVPIGYPVNTMSGYGGTTGVSLEQTVNGLVIGNTYVLEFWAGGEYGTLYIYKGLFSINLGFGDTLLRNKVTEAVTGTGTRYIIEFNATSTSHTIKFTNWGHICTLCTELILDDVRLYTLAELSASVPHCTLGIDDASVSQSMTNVSPNPVTNELHVEINGNELSEIILYDIASRKIFDQSFTNSISINTEQLSKGIYFYEVRNKKGVIKKGKIVKE